MDGELRYKMVRDQIRERHDDVRAERSIRRSRLERQARSVDTGWASGIVSVTGALTRRVARRALSA